MAGIGLVLLLVAGLAPVQAAPVTGLNVSKSADTVSAAPGDTVTFTVNVGNSSGKRLKVTVVDDLTGVVDDADYRDDATAKGARLSATATKLTWTLKLNPGQTAKFTYSVKVKKGGNGKLTGALWAEAAGYGKTARCPVTVKVDSGKSPSPSPSPSGSPSGSPTPPGPSPEPPKPTKLVVKKTASRTVVNGGKPLTYTIKVTNPGKTEKSVDLTDDLTEILKYATFVSVKANIGDAPVFSTPNLTWQGSLAPGESVDIEYDVQLYRSNRGEQIMRNTVVVPDSNCEDGSSDSACRTVVPIADLILSKEGRPRRAIVGKTYRYYVTLTNAGGYDLIGSYPAIAVDNMTGVLDDATYNNDVTQTSGPAGTIDWSSPKMKFTVPLKVGESASFNYSMTYNGGGDKDMINTIQSETKIPESAVGAEPVAQPAQPPTEAAEAAASDECAVDLAVPGRTTGNRTPTGSGVRQLATTGPAISPLWLAATGVTMLVVSIGTLVVLRRRMDN